MSSYALDQTWKLEAERLRMLEAALDPLTTEHLSMLGVGSGWRCLEVGAGRGSIAAWLAERVGDRGKVVATDLEVTLLHELRRPNLEIVRSNVLEDNLPQAEFDLVHARLVVSHLGERRLEAIQRMIAALRPGGWLMIEENDLLWNEAKEWPISHPAAGRLLLKLWVGLGRILEKGGHDVNWGRWVAPTLRNAGLVEVQGEGRCRIGSGRVERELTRLTALRFREHLLQMGAVSGEEFDLLMKALSAPSVEAAGMGGMFVSAWGRRPS